MPDQRPVQRWKAGDNVVLTGLRVGAIAGRRGRITAIRYMTGQRFDAEGERLKEPHPDWIAYTFTPDEQGFPMDKLFYDDDFKSFPWADV